MYIFSSATLFLYFLIYLILIVLSSYSVVKDNYSLDRFTFLFSFFIFILFIFNRNGLGVDEFTYRFYYDSYLPYTNNFKFELGFRLLFDIMKYVDLPTKYFNNCIATIILSLTSILVWITEKKYKSLVLLSIIFSGFFIDFIFNAYRQAFGVLFLIAAVFLFQNKKIFFSLIFFSLSVLFHWSAVIIIMIIVVSYILRNYDLKFLLISLIALHFLSIFININFINSVDYSFLNHFGLENLNSAIKNYLLTSGNSFYDSNLNWKLITLLPIIFSYTVCYISYKNNFIYNLYILISIYCYFFIGMDYSFRNYYWLLPFFSFILPFVLLKKERIVMITFFLILNAFIGFFYSSLIPMIYL